MKYELIVNAKSDENDKFSVQSHDVILADSVIHLAAQLMILLVSLANREASAKQQKEVDDDIPF